MGIPEDTRLTRHSRKALKLHLHDERKSHTLQEFKERDIVVYIEKAHYVNLRLLVGKQPSLHVKMAWLAIHAMFARWFRNFSYPLI
jgi:hypothetical protein